MNSDYIKYFGLATGNPGERVDEPIIAPWDRPALKEYAVYDSDTEDIVPGSRTSNCSTANKQRDWLEGAGCKVHVVTILSKGTEVEYRQV